MQLNHIIFGLFLLALVINASADGCPGVISLNNNDEFSVGDTIQTLLTTTISPVLGRRNIDLVVKDPDGGVFYSYYGTLDNDTYAMQFQSEVTNSFLTGTYKTTARITVYEFANLSEEVCTESTYDFFEIETNRTVYDAIILQILPDFQRQIQEIDTCYNITIKDEDSTDTIVYPVCLQGVFPAGYSIGVRQIVIANITSAMLENVSLEISAGAPYYPQAVINALYNSFQSQNSDLDIIAEKTDSLYNLTRKNQKDMSIIMMRLNVTTEELYIQRMIIQNALSNLTQRGVKGGTDPILNQPWKLWTGFVGGIIATILAILYLAKRRAKEKVE